MQSRSGRPSRPGDTAGRSAVRAPPPDGELTSENAPQPAGGGDGGPAGDEIQIVLPAGPGQLPPDRPRPIDGVLEALEAGDIPALGRGLFNRLQPVAEALEPTLGAARDALAGLTGPTLVGHLMSGSGSAYFGLARDRDAAEDAARRLVSPGLGRVRVVTCGP